MINLISNALKYSSKKSTVTVEVSLKNLYNPKNQFDMLKNNQKKTYKQLLDMLNEEVVKKEQKLQFSKQAEKSSNFKSSHLLHSHVPQPIDNLYYIEYEMKIIDTGPGISEDSL